MFSVIIFVTQEKSVGQQIKERRELLGISQRELADRVGIKQPSLSSIESGHSTPRDATLFALARELNDEFGSDAALAYLARRGSSSWDHLIRPVVSALLKNDLFLDLVVYRLANASERFREMIDPEILKQVTERAENLVELLAQEPNSVGPMKKAEMIWARSIGKVDGGEEEEKVRKTG